MANGTDGEGGKRIPRSKFVSKPKSLRVVKPRGRLSKEDQESYSVIVEQLTQEKKPASLAERKLVESIALTYVRLQNARRLETETLNRYISEVQGRLPKPIDAQKAMAIAFAENASEIELLQRNEEVIQDAWYNAMRELDRVQRARPKRDVTTSDPKAEKIHLVKPPEPK
jgi:hypothetical protein